MDQELEWIQLKRCSFRLKWKTGNFVVVGLNAFVSFLSLRFVWTLRIEWSADAFYRTQAVLAFNQTISTLLSQIILKYLSNWNYKKNTIDLFSVQFDERKHALLFVADQPFRSAIRLTGNEYSEQKKLIFGNTSRMLLNFWHFHFLFDLRCSIPFIRIVH